MKYSIPHESVGHISRTVPRGEFDPRITIFSRLKETKKKTRILSVSAYFGLAPFLWLSGVYHQQNPVLKHHTKYSLGFAFLTLCAFIIYVVQNSIAYSIFRYFWRPTMEEFSASAIWQAIYVFADMAVSLTAAFAWILAWSICVVGASNGRTPTISVMTWLTSKKWAIRFGVVWMFLAELVFVVVFGLGVRSVQLSAREQSSTAKVYILYTIGGYIPLPDVYQSFTPSRWMVTMAFYPTVIAGLEKFGEDGVAILPLTEENFKQATKTGKFIFVASHGGSTSGSFTLSMNPHIQYSPSDVDVTSVGEDLQFAYFAGCYTGNLEAEWQQRLGAGEMVMFDRISYVDEHMLWVWLKSPGVIKQLQ